ncbi:MAG: hypothetical protein IH596_04910 [Bacteroidales bacterium]|nr:hypothetical protein [Bacteroidales bacterium]
MKRVFFFIGSFLLLLISAQAQDLTLDEIMTKHYQASGMEKLQQVNTVIMIGLRVQQDIMPLKIVRKRPNLSLMEFDVADLTAYQAYDGNIGWSTAPWTGDASPKPLPESRTRDLMYQSDFDGMLYNWKEKGHHLELEGVDTMDTKLAYKIKLVRADSAIQYYFIGMGDFLLKKQTTFRMIRGEEISIENIFTDYRPVEGIPFAFNIETRYPGRSVSMEFETIELNQSVEDDLFKMP